MNPALEVGIGGNATRGVKTNMVPEHSTILCPSHHLLKHYLSVAGKPQLFER